MNISDELMGRFFQGHCNPEEVAEVLHYLEENPEFAEKYTGKREWDLISANDYCLEKARAARLFENIQGSISKEPFSLNKSVRWAIAASFLLFVAAGLLVFKNTKADLQQIAQAKKSDIPWRSIDNSSENSREIVLTDGSVIQLDAHSKVTFQVPFPANKREIRLTGKAFFKVAKDKRRPFTVFSGRISTTALGTQFSVEAFAANSTIRIKLHEGKVLVHRLNSNEIPHQSYYLNPGQQLVYNSPTGRISIDSFESVRKKPMHGLPLNDRKTGLIISFDRQPIGLVFQQLERAYNINLTYSPEGLKDNFFTGSFNRTDSLERILRIIAQTNNLDIRKSNSGYKIVKTH
jgi:transmembrane sensor